jgi:hypothetical protein
MEPLKGMKSFTNIFNQLTSLVIGESVHHTFLSLPPSLPSFPL